MDTQKVLATAQQHLTTLTGHVFDILSVSKPVTPAAAVNLAKIVSKLSPLVANLIEFNTCEFLNDKPEFKKHGFWRRQDPGFPDIVFDGVTPIPGFEIKAWFPLATEITARFKDSQNHFLQDNTHVAVIAWLPEFLIYGRPKIVGVFTASGASVAKARDAHYHNPPDYLVLEPENTSARTRNLQQTNTNGYKWQGRTDVAEENANKAAALALVRSWGADAIQYKSTPDYQAKLHELIGRFKYRMDTNFAKMDRIGHTELDVFAQQIYATEFAGKTVGQWNRLLSGDNNEAIADALTAQFDITDHSERLVK